MKETYKDGWPSRRLRNACAESPRVSHRIQDPLYDTYTALLGDSERCLHGSDADKVRSGCLL